MKTGIDIIDFINSLKNPNEIAKFIEKEGIKGKPRDGKECILVKLFHKHGLKNIFVFLDSLEYENKQFKLSSQACGFISKFDIYGYPKLILR